MENNSHTEQQTSSWEKLIDERLPTGVEITYSTSEEKPIIKEVMDLVGSDSRFFAIMFEGEGVIFINDSRVTVRNLNNIKVSVDGAVVTEISQSTQSGGGHQTIEASDGSTITGVSQRISRQ